MIYPSRKVNTFTHCPRLGFVSILSNAIWLSERTKLFPAADESEVEVQ